MTAWIDMYVACAGSPVGAAEYNTRSLLASYYTHEVSVTAVRYWTGE
jgi:hypothetical protein